VSAIPERPVERYSKVQYLDSEQKGIVLLLRLAFASRLASLLLRWKNADTVFIVLRFSFQVWICSPTVAMPMLSTPSTACQSRSACTIARSLTYACFLETVFGRSALRRLRAAASSSGLKGPEILFPSGARTFHRSDSSLLTSLVDSRLLLV